MSFRVAGSLDDTLYEVEVTGDPADPVVGSKRVRGLFRQYEGETVLASPTGPAYVVSGDDPASVLCLLTAHTRVTRADAHAPRLLDPLPAGSVR